MTLLKCFLATTFYRILSYMSYFFYFFVGSGFLHPNIYYRTKMECTTQGSGAKIITSKYNSCGLTTALLKYKEEIIQAEACVDHVHMLVSIPPYVSVAQFMISRAKAV